MAAAVVRGKKNGMNKNTSVKPIQGTWATGKAAALRRRTKGAAKLPNAHILRRVEARAPKCCCVL